MPVEVSRPRSAVAVPGIAPPPHRTPGRQAWADASPAPGTAPAPRPASRSYQSRSPPSPLGSTDRPCPRGSASPRCAAGAPATHRGWRGVWPPCRGAGRDRASPSGPRPRRWRPRDPRSRAVAARQAGARTWRRTASASASAADGAAARCGPAVHRAPPSRHRVRRRRCRAPPWLPAAGRAERGRPSAGPTSKRRCRASRRKLYAAADGVGILRTS